jgi:hypothetical protein
MFRNTNPLSRAGRAGRRNEDEQPAHGSLEREARRREIMLLLEEIRAPQPTSATICSRGAAR